MIPTRLHSLFGAPLLATLVLAGSVDVAVAVTYTAKLLQPAGATSSYAGGNTNLNQVGQVRGASFDHATIWSGTAASAVDIHPAGYFASTINAASGNYQVGTATSVGPSHAMLWNGTAASAVDLHPAAGFSMTTATGIDGTTQVGFGTPQPPGSALFHAVLWHGTAASAVNLNPPGYFNSFANDVYGNTQVGWAQPTGAGIYLAYTWTGTATSGVNVTPPSFTSAEIQGIWQTTMVGFGSGTQTGGQYHALLWDDTTTSDVVDLHPADCERSVAREVAGLYQVGEAMGAATSGNEHAFVWTGSAASAFDLHSLVQAINPALVSSDAISVAENGDIVGIAQTANHEPVAVMWTLVPEPASTALVVCGLAFASCVQVRRRW